MLESSVYRLQLMQLLVMFISIYDNNFDMILFTRDFNILKKILKIPYFKYQVPINILQYLLFKMSGKEATSAPEKKKKESILDLTRYLEKAIRVKFSGGREVSGILKGFDPLVNLVLDNTLEYLRDPDEPMKLTEDTRTLGLVVCRGTSIVLICPVDGMEAIANPFVQQD